ncbi:L-type lectin-domain containing receptor kinase IX.1-like [Gossypium australe]|uniref:L-type lectin-domain containing receptor kinase IX.1-like n=1 Tax=Gossypium australe TaxID=47621 RepID=A0A5B6VZZ5_9ROSI|nr:L-type lectin-domain containing receptor kinase IX.1-like [Gossypium australe]
MSGNMNINAISEEEIEGENLSGIRPYDFENDRDCNLSPDLLRMVEQEEKQILPYKESAEIVNLGGRQEKKEVKIRACITAETSETSLSYSKNSKISSHGHIKTWLV